MMLRFTAWALFLLGVLHVVFGVLRYQEPLLDALNAGFVGTLQTPEIRRTAFWFLMSGPLLMLIGQLSVRAVGLGDWVALRWVGIYGLLVSLVGVAAFPASPLWVLLVISVLLLAGNLHPLGRKVPVI